MNEFELRSQLRGLRDGREPERDLWAGIEARLEPRRRKSPLWPFAMAASLLIAAVLVSMFRTNPLDADIDQFAAIRTRQQSEGIELSYRAALAELAARPLPLELRPAAKEIDASLREIELALAQAPDSPPLLAQLRRTYETRLRLGQRGFTGYNS